MKRVGGGASPSKEFVLERGNEMRLKWFSVRCFKKPAPVCVGMEKTTEESLNRSVVYDQTVQRSCIGELVARAIMLPYMRVCKMLYVCCNLHSSEYNSDCHESFTMKFLGTS